jgi:hypothetical protein
LGFVEAVVFCVEKLDLGFVLKSLIYNKMQKHNNSAITIQNIPVKSKFGSAFARNKQKMRVVSIFRNMVY